MRAAPSDRAGLGDGTANPDRFAEGPAPLAREVHALGRHFGIRVEREMVDADVPVRRAVPAACSGGGLGAVQWSGATRGSCSRCWERSVTANGRRAPAARHRPGSRSRMRGHRSRPSGRVLLHGRTHSALKGIRTPR
ncbi:alpha-galactosidase [Streptomyces xantholiticus]